MVSRLSKFCVRDFSSFFVNIFGNRDSSAQLRFICSQSEIIVFGIFVGDIDEGCG